MNRQTWYAASAIALALAAVIATMSGNRAHEVGSGDSRGARSSASRETTPPQENRKSDSRSRVEQRKESSKLAEIRLAVEQKDGLRLLKAVQTIGKGDFQNVWAILGELPDQAFTNQLKATAVNRGAYLDGLESVLPSIDGSTGSGLIRNEFLREAFAGSRASLAELQQLALARGNDKEKSSAFEGVAMSLAGRRELGSLGIESLSELSGGMLKAVMDGIGKYPANYMTSLKEGEFELKTAESLDLVHRLLSLKMVDKASVEGMAVSLSRVFPEKGWNVMQRKWPELAKEPAIADAFFKSISQNKPTGALDFSLGNESISPGAFGSVIGRSLAEDSTKVTDWFEKNRADLSPQRADQVVSELAKVSAGGGDFQAAEKWLAQIADPSKKKEIEAAITGEQRKVIEEETKKDPQAAMNAILAGTSKYGDKWVETVMDQWITASPDQSWAWYNQHSKSLSQMQLQGVSASFAKKALDLGDLDNAEQWIGQIKAPELKARLDKRLSEARAR